MRPEKKMVLSNLQCVDLRFKTLYFLKPYLLRVGRESYVSYSIIFLQRSSSLTVIYSVMQKSILMLKTIFSKKERIKTCFFHMNFLYQWYLNYESNTPSYYPDVRVLTNPDGTRSSRGSFMVPNNNFIPCCWRYRYCKMHKETMHDKYTWYIFQSVFILVCTFSFSLYACTRPLIIEEWDIILPFDF